MTTLNANVIFIVVFCKDGKIMLALLFATHKSAEDKYDTLMASLKPKGKDALKIIGSPLYA